MQIPRFRPIIKTILQTNPKVFICVYISSTFFQYEVLQNYSLRDSLAGERGYTHTWLSFVALDGTAQ
jgi:hypothetical protein